MDSISDNLRATAISNFVTPARQKYNCNTLNVPKQIKVRCKSDSNSPFPENYFTNATKNKIKRNDENVSVRASRPRTPLQTLNLNRKIGSASARMTVSFVNKCTTTEMGPTFGTPKRQELGRSQIASSHKTPSVNFNMLSNESRSKYASKNFPTCTAIINRSKTFIIYDENSNSKENYLSPIVSAFQENMNVKDDCINKDIHKKMALATKQSKKEANLGSIGNAHGTAKFAYEDNIDICDVTEASNLLNQRIDLHLQDGTQEQSFLCSSTAPLNFGGPPNSVPNPMSDKAKSDNAYSSLKNIGRFGSFPPTETIGSVFWGEDEGNVEETISLNDMIRAANIWDIMENNQYQYCSSRSLDFPVEPPLMQEPIFQLDIEPASIEIPWNDIHNYL